MSSEILYRRLQRSMSSWNKASATSVYFRTFLKGLAHCFFFLSFFPLFDVLVSSSLPLLQSSSLACAVPPCVALVLTCLSPSGISLFGRDRINAGRWLLTEGNSLPSRLFCPISVLGAGCMVLLKPAAALLCTTWHGASQPQGGDRCFWRNNQKPRFNIPSPKPKKSGCSETARFQSCLFIII